ncbi:uncharacterized protein GIQ15_00059 [Arthroderma uncinatum]|uniref:uncharacterized protein n=1 Tax=Arthroderma uncinatum TaxID=74035 RepID=UPI00144ADB99|nr:uncharacterized protein GIQ15_00059 [Arthroderma uncinatum]KAF3490542.1 hypothetical protein GIQ15_00059 [Arthroderma uncinatum]
MLSTAGSRRIHSPGCTPGLVGPRSGLDVAGIRENLQLLIDLSSQLPSSTVLSPQESGVFRDSCSTLAKALTAHTQGHDGILAPLSDCAGVLEASAPSEQAEESETAREAPGNDHELLSILNSLTKVNESFRQRRIEQRQVYDQYQAKCEGLSKRISELEDEVDTLQRETFNNTIELECMRGTVSGLDSWLDDWKRQHDSESHQNLALKRPAKSRGKRSKYFEHLDRLEEQRDGLIDGLSAWMRGWNDANDGFRGHPGSLDQNR